MLAQLETLTNSVEKGVIKDGEANAGVAAMVADTSSLDDKLTSGISWTRDEVAKRLEALGHSLNELGPKTSAYQ